jgi:hypothetical protein
MPLSAAVARRRLCLAVARQHGAARGIEGLPLLDFVQRWDGDGFLAIEAYERGVD